MLQLGDPWRLPLLWWRAAVLTLVCALPLPAGAQETSPAAVTQAVADRRSRVAEFQVIKAAAEELGIRVWLFGGTAAGFAHYVRWDLAREAGDERYRPTFFDYDFTNIYRSTQDADLVVDATPAQAQALERLIREKMSFLQGSKEYWEVRLLRQDRVAPGGQVKQALLANPDFLGQHTDSNSTGMIELTDPPPGEGVVRDLRDWESREPFFLQDVASGRLHYYWSPTHTETTRFRQGDNPPLFSVIRYLVKAFQYGLEVDGEDRERVRAVIEAFDPKRDYRQMSGWAQGWLERYGPNLIRHAVDIEYAWTTLQELGLREKLISLSDPQTEKSLGWWLSREPLRTLPLGRKGRSARRLGIGVVAHETGDFLAYESITRDMTGRPNVLISRPGYPGEAAGLGAGFYTRQGTIGARGTGLTIRFQVDPAAREGTDFSVHGDFVVFHNRAALQVIPESLDLSIYQFFKALRGGLKIDPNDRGIWMKFKRRLTLTRFRSPEEEEKVLALVTRAVGRLLAREHSNLQADSRDARVLREWLSLRVAADHPDILGALLGQPRFESYLVGEVLSLPGWERYPELILPLIRHDQDSAGWVAQQLLGEPRWSGQVELLRAVLEENIKDVPKIRQRMIASGFDPNWKAWKRIEPLFSKPPWNGHPELVQYLIEQGPPGWSRAARVLALPGWEGHPELLLALISTAPDSWDRSDLAESIGLEELVRRPHWKNHPLLVQLCGGWKPTLRRIRKALRRRSIDTTEQVLELLGTLGSSSLPECR